MLWILISLPISKEGLHRYTAVLKCFLCRQDLLLFPILPFWHLSITAFFFVWKPSQTNPIPEQARDSVTWIGHRKKCCILTPLLWLYTKSMESWVHFQTKKEMFLSLKFMSFQHFCNDQPSLWKYMMKTVASGCSIFAHLVIPQTSWRSMHA